MATSVTNRANNLPEWRQTPSLLSEAAMRLRDQLQFQIPPVVLSHCFFLAIAVVAAGFSSRPAAALLGRWTPGDSTIGGTAVHVALLPGDGHPYHSRIVWWQDEGSESFIGGQLGWRDSSGIDCASYPGSVFTQLGLPDPGANIFCSGFTQLPDGRLIVVGGTESGTENGMVHAFVFKPDTGRGSGSWTRVDSMADRRWYPSATLLPDGRVLATSGSKYPVINFFGGRTGGAAAPTDTSIGRYGMVATGVWDSSVLPPSPTTNWPSPRTGHTAVRFPGYYNMFVYFGGRDRAGTLLNETWLNAHSPQATGDDDLYSWVKQTYFPFSGNVLPANRTEHTAVMKDNSHMLVFGGVRDSSSPDYS